MPERNLCVESGCQAACCFNKFLFYRGTVTDSFPQAKEVSYGDLDDMEFPGVYYTKFVARFLVRIVGKCPNLEEDFNCKIHEVKPEACGNFEKDGKKCLDIKKCMGP
jgi:Fe-S-cluster containining protein